MNEASFALATQLLEAAVAVAHGQLQDLVPLQREALLQLFRAKRFHTEYKEWAAEKVSSKRTGFKEYNRRYAELNRVYSDVCLLEKELASIQQTLGLPEFSVSKETQQRLNRVKKDRSVQLSEYMPEVPEFAEFSAVINTEMKVRLRAQIKYQTLLRIKSHFSSQCALWEKRDAALNTFLTKSLAQMVEEVASIKATDGNESESRDEMDVGDGDEGDEDELKGDDEGDGEGESKNDAGEAKKNGNADFELGDATELGEHNTTGHERRGLETNMEPRNENETQHTQSDKAGNEALGNPETPTSTMEID